jgi:cell division protein FtsL
MKDLRLIRLLGARGSAATRLVLIVLCAAILTLGAVVFVWQRYQYVRLGFEVSALRQRRAELEEVIEPLEIEVEYLSRLERIETLARDRLGMRPPRVHQVRILNGHDATALPSR